jgi:hypothetical protein
MASLTVLPDGIFLWLFSERLSCKIAPIAMKVEIPDKLKADVPQTIWGKILTATPVIMTVIATALAGLSSSEMTRAQYSRSQAAQQQSKAGDQWGFFQAKRLRGSMQLSTLDLLKSTTNIRPLEASVIHQYGSSIETQPLAGAEAALVQGQLPPIPPPPILDPTLKDALNALESDSADAEAKIVIGRVSDTVLREAMMAAKDRVHLFDAATGPVNDAINRLEKALLQQGADQQTTRNFVAARLAYTASRYDAEARLNQAVANLHEIEVRRSNLIADRHHRRSQRFFVGMLGAQAAVIIATFALAAQKRSFLWLLAAAAGLAAISFAVYVYLFV